MFNQLVAASVLQSDESLLIVSRPYRTACWFVAVLATGAVGGLVASVAPPRLRLIGLFAIVLGAALGWLAGRLAVTLRMPSRRAAVLGGFLTGVTGCAVATLLHWQAYARELQAAEKSNAGRAIMTGMLKAAEENAPADPESQAALAEFRDSAARALDELRNRRTFNAYLSHRVISLSLTGWLPAVLWGIEVMLAGAAGAFVARLLAIRPFCNVCDNFLIASRRYQFRAPLPSTVMAVIGRREIAIGDSVSLRLFSCRCGGTAPQVQFEIAPNGGSSVSSGTCEIARDELKPLKRLIDQADGIDCES